MVQFMPEPVAQGTLDILGALTLEEQSISPDIEKILGRAPVPLPNGPTTTSLPSADRDRSFARS